MATITATFDTKDKTLTLSMDGAEVADVAEVLFYRRYDGDKFACSVTTCSEDEESDVRTTNRLTASEAGLVPSLLDDVAAFLGDRR